MNTFIAIDSLGNVTRSGSLTNAADVEAQVPDVGGSIIPGFTGRPGLDRWDGSGVVPIELPKPSPDEQRVRLRARLAERRWEIETGGFSFGGKRVSSDPVSQAKIQGIMVGVQLAGSSFSAPWKCKDGWVWIDSKSGPALVAAGLKHVSASFEREEELSVAIDAATDAELDELAVAVEEFWIEPSTVQLALASLWDRVKGLVGSAVGLITSK